MRLLVSAGLVVAATLALAAAGLALLAARSRSHRRAPGLSGGGTLAPCPRSPNCVTSLSADPPHAVEPILFEGAPDAAWERLRSVVASLPEARPTDEAPGFLHVEFRSRLFGFVDDVEFLLDAPNHRIDVRSASRVGWSDGGANRRRFEAIARRFRTSS